MTVEEIIRPGDKIDISFLQQVENPEEGGALSRIFKSKVLDLKENGSVVISMPTEGGKLVLLPLEVRLEFVFFSRGGLYRAIGQVRERYKQDNIYMLEIELKSQLEKYQRREFFRYPYVLDVCYYKITDVEAKLDSGKEVFIKVREGKECSERECRGKIVDLSGGGIRFRTDQKLANGQYLLFEIHLENDNFDKQYYIIAQAISCVETDIGGEKNRFEARAKFLIRDNNTREEIIRFIFEEERKSRQRGKR